MAIADKPYAEIAELSEVYKSFHKSREIKEFLAVVSQGKAANEWELTCMLLPPNCPVT